MLLEKGQKVGRKTLRSKLKVSVLLYQTKIHITLYVYQENYQSISPYCMASKHSIIYTVFSFTCDITFFKYPQKSENFKPFVPDCCMDPTELKLRPE